METKDLPVSLPMYWSQSSTKNFYEANENSNSSSKEIKCSVNSVFRRHSDSLQEINMARDTLIFLLQHLGFTINMKKSVVEPVHQIQFLGVEVDSLNLKLSLPPEKMEKIISQCQAMLESSQVSIRDLTKLLGLLSSSAVAVLPAPLQYRAIQSQQIKELSRHKNFDSKISLSEEAKEELDWWCQNLQLANGRSLVSPPPQLVISSDASKRGWGAYCKGERTGGQWSASEQGLHINVLELKAAKLAILAFHKLHSQALSIHIQMDNIVTLTYLKKMGGTHSQLLTQISKEIWKYLFAHQIIITVEYLPGCLNIEADHQSRTVEDPEEWMLKPQIFRELCKARGTPSTDLFASRLTHQVPLYYSWKIDPYSIG